MHLFSIEYNNKLYFIKTSDQIINKLIKKNVNENVLERVGLSTISNNSK